MFDADRITRIDIVDSTWNGVAIGTAVGGGLAFGLWQAAKGTDDFGAGFLYAWLAGGALPLGIVIGHDVDLATNEPIYARPSERPRATFVPLVGRNRNGFAVRVGF